MIAWDVFRTTTTKARASGRASGSYATVGNSGWAQDRFSNFHDYNTRSEGYSRFETALNGQWYTTTGMSWVTEKNSVTRTWVSQRSNQVTYNPIASRTTLTSLSTFNSSFSLISTYLLLPQIMGLYTTTTIERQSRAWRTQIRSNFSPIYSTRTTMVRGTTRLTTFTSNVWIPSTVQLQTWVTYPDTAITQTGVTSFVTFDQSDFDQIVVGDMVMMDSKGFAFISEANTDTPWKAVAEYSMQTATRTTFSSVTGSMTRLILQSSTSRFTTITETNKNLFNIVFSTIATNGLQVAINWFPSSTWRYVFNSEGDDEYNYELADTTISRLISVNTDAATRTIQENVYTSITDSSFSHTASASASNQHGSTYGYTTHKGKTNLTFIDASHQMFLAWDEFAPVLYRETANLTPFAPADLDSSRSSFETYAPFMTLAGGLSFFADAFFLNGAVAHLPFPTFSAIARGVSGTTTVFGSRIGASFSSRWSWREDDRFFTSSGEAELQEADSLPVGVKQDDLLFGGRLLPNSRYTEIIYNTHALIITTYDGSTSGTQSRLVIPTSPSFVSEANNTITHRSYIPIVSGAGVFITYYPKEVIE